MTMFRNGRGVAATGKRNGVAFAHILRTASIVAVAWSCISPASSDESRPPPPDIKSLDPIEYQSFLGPVLEFLRSQGYQKAENVKVVVMAYREGGTDKLIAFKFDGSAPGEIIKEYKEGELMIPEVGGNVSEAIIVYTASDAKVKSCGGGGGTPYCPFPP